MFPCPRACLRIWSRETGSAVPSRVSLLIFILRECGLATQVWRSRPASACSFFKLQAILLVFCIHYNICFVKQSAPAVESYARIPGNRAIHCTMYLRRHPMLHFVQLLLYLRCTEGCFLWHNSSSNHKAPQSRLWSRPPSINTRH